MLHGLFGSKRDFQSTAKRIGQLTGHAMYGIDLRNHGTSPHGLPHTSEAMAQDVIKFIESRDWWVPPVLVGHSMGATVAMLVSLLRPDLLSKLVVIDNAPVTRPLEQKFYEDLKGMCRLETDYHQFCDKSQLDQSRHIDNVLSEYEPDPKVRFFLKTNIIKLNKSHLHGKQPHALFRVPVQQFLKQDVLHGLGLWPELPEGTTAFTKPVLILKAAKSEFIQSQDEFVDLFPCNQYEIYNCGHWIVSDDPNKFIKDMVQFLQI
jgi:pimeloyl-ACP methyl ester carboxylesterase